MKTSLILLAMMAPCWGNTMFQIDWSGVVTTASVHGIDHTQSSFALGIQSGTPIFGSMTFDMGLAPAPALNIGSGQTQIQFDNTDPNPVWVGGSFTIVLPTLPADALPIPSTFTVTPHRPPADGVETITPEARQTLGFTFCDATCSAVLAGGRFHDSWSIPGVLKQESIYTLGLLIASNNAFLPRPPGAPVEFDVSGLSSGSIFGATQFTEDLSNPQPPLFGIRENYTVGGNFNLTQATGRFIETTPEPGTWALGLAGLALVLFRRTSGLRRRK